MPTVYVTDFNELPTFEVYDTKPSGFPSDEIELTDTELARVQAAEVEFAAAQSMLRDKVGGHICAEHICPRCGAVTDDLSDECYDCMESPNEQRPPPAPCQRGS